MEKNIDSCSSVRPKNDLQSKGRKRKESSDKGGESSTAASSANALWRTYGRKLQKTSETFAVSNLLQGLDRFDFGSVTREVRMLSARICKHYSKVNSIVPLSHIDVEKERLTNQQDTGVTQYDVIDLENEPLRVHATAGDIPIVILDSDDEDSGCQGHSHLFKQKVLVESTHKLPEKASTVSFHATAGDIPIVVLGSDDEVSGCQGHSHLFKEKVLVESTHELPEKALTVSNTPDVKTPNVEAKRTLASHDIQEDKSAHIDTKNDIEVRENEKVKASLNLTGSSPDNHNIQADENAYAGIVHSIQFTYSEKVETSGDDAEGSTAKCNIKLDLSANSGIVEKDKNLDIYVGDDSLAKNDNGDETHVGDKCSTDAASCSPTKSNVQVNESAHAAENIMIVKNSDRQIDVEYDGITKIGIENDIEDRDCKNKALSNDVEGLPDKHDIKSDKNAYASMESIMVIEEYNHQVHVEDGIAKIGIENDTEDRDCKNKALSDVVESLPNKHDMNLDENACARMEMNMVIEEDNHQVHVEDIDLVEIWNEMSFALECTKDSVADSATDECMEEHGEDCDHTFVLKDDLGYVCRICGFIQRSIDTIFEFQYTKATKSTRTYAYEPRNTSFSDSIDVIPNLIKSPSFAVTEIAAHPRHRKEMKPHQVEGFNFLCSNLVTDDPGGCILAHAPGSGKTFMVISFIQSFLAKYPDARPLVVLPKGILATWKNEFLKWQVEAIPLLDFCTSKAENRSQQLDVLRKWVGAKSILFLGYKQFSVIVCDNSKSAVVAECQDILLKVPTILILDEGHTPRNEETDVLWSLSKVKTPRKVVLSGTLYQNHVKEVFNILNLVRPRFLKLRDPRMIVKRIMSRVQISKRKHLKVELDSAFFDLVEYTLQKDEDFKRRKAVIQDLREMTSNVLHYYKGDFLDELPGLVDFMVVLNLSPSQKDEVQSLRKLDKFKRTSLGSAMYIHPQLKSFSEICSAAGEKGLNVDDKKIDAVLQQLDIREGVKAKFFLNILGLCESAGEKLLVFSQYILPLKLLERLSAKVKGWSLGKELFMITGDSNTEQREWCMDCFNSSPTARVFFGSIKACGEGISLVGASRIIILDVHLNPSVTRQAIGRAFRPGQKKKVYAYRLIAADSPEQEDYLTCSRKELISKMWFEWNENCGDQDFEVKTTDVNECGDVFFESPGLREDLNVLYKR